MVLALRAANKAHVDLEEDILRQVDEKGYAEVGVESPTRTEWRRHVLHMILRTCY